MKLISTTLLSGFNCYSSRSVICLTIDCLPDATLARYSSDDIALEELLAIAPEIEEWCSSVRGQRLTGALLGDFVWQLALMFQQRLREVGVNFGATFECGNGRIKIVYHCRDKQWGENAGKIAMALIQRSLPKAIRDVSSAPINFEFDGPVAPETWVGSGRKVHQDTALLLECADKRGIPWRRITGKIARLGLGAAQKIVMGSATDTLGWVDVWRSDRKKTSYQRLQEMGLGVNRPLSVATRLSNKGAKRRYCRLLVMYNEVVAAKEKFADDFHDITELLGEEIRGIAIRSTQVLGLEIAEVALWTDNVATGPAVVVSVNSKPQLNTYLGDEGGTGRDLAAPILDHLFPDAGQGRIPTIVLTAESASERVTCGLANLFMLQGKRVGAVTRKSSSVDGEQVGAMNGEDNLSVVLDDPFVEIAIYQAHLKRLLQNGLGLDRCTVGVVCGGELGDALEKEPCQEGLKLLATACQETLVVGADVVELLADIPFRSANKLCVVSSAGITPAIKAHIKSGGRAVTLNHDMLVWHDSLVKEDSILLTVADELKPAAVFAAAIAWSAGIEVPHLRSAMRCLDKDLMTSMLPIRSFEQDGYRVVLIDVHSNQLPEIESFMARSCAPEQRINVVLACVPRPQDLTGYGKAKAVLFAEDVDRETIDAIGPGSETRLSVKDDHTALAKALSLAEEGDWVIIYCHDRYQWDGDLSCFSHAQNNGSKSAGLQEESPEVAAPSLLWTGQEIAEATGGHWIAGDGDAVRATGFNYALGLSRYTQPGDLALTVNRDQWKLSKTRKGVAPPLKVQVETYFASGAEAVIVHQKIDDLPADKPVLLVDDTLKALDDLAIASRKRFHGRIIAVTGSVGKTTTRELLKHILSHQGKAFASQKNFNDNKGMPRSMVMTPRDTDWGIYEFSMFACKRSPLLKPHVAVITEIQPVHIEAFHTLEGIADEKSMIFDGLEPGGTAVIGHDTPVYHRLRRKVERRGDLSLITFGEHPESDVRLIDCHLDMNGSDVEANICGEKITYRLPLAGRHAVMNSLAALAAVKAAGGDWRQAAKDYISMDVLPHRIQREEIALRGGHFTLLDDSFSASPPSVRAGLNVFSTLPLKGRGKRIAVLGRNRELGRRSFEIHAEMARAVLDARIDRVFTYGDEMLHLRDALPEAMRAYHAVDSKGLISAVLRELQPDDHIYIKGTKRYLKPIADLGVVLRSESLTALADQAAKNPIHETVKMGEIGSRYQENMSVKTVGDRYTREMEIYSDLDLTPKLVIESPGSVDRFDMILVGDTGFGESYRQLVGGSRGQGRLLTERGYNYALGKMRPALCDADLVIANLETPVTDLEESPFADVKEYVHWAHVDETPATLKAHNISVVALANNHTFDFGRPGFEQTLDVLHQKGFHMFGAGMNLAEARKPFIGETLVSGRRFRFAIFSAFAVMRSYRERYKCYATATEGGICPFDANAIADQIVQLKELDPELFTIVFPHWGANYRWRSRKQSKQADALVEAGADLIIGHGAHMLQEVERRGGRWIVYSLGNFIFNSPGRYKQEHAPPYSLMARLRIVPSASGETLTPKILLYPIVSDNRLTDYQPRFVTTSEFSEVVALLGEQCPDPADFAQSFSKGRDQYGRYLEVDLQSFAASRVR